MKTRRKRRWQLAILLLSLVLLASMWKTFERHQVYFPSRVFASTGAELGRPFENVEFQADDGVRLHGWFFPANTNSPRKDLVVLFCHGNAGNVSHRLEAAEGLLQTGVAVLLFDYRGYGRSQGTPTEKGTYLDAEAAWRWLRQRGFGGQQIVAYGESLGGGVAAELAVRQPLAGLVLQSTFTSIPDIGAELFPWLPVRWLASIKYDTRAKLPQIKIPLLILHSRTDTLVRFHHAQENFAVANEPKLFCELEGGHNESVTDSESFKPALERFLALIKPASPNQ